MVATKEVELQSEGVVKHSFNLDNVEKWLAEGTYAWSGCGQLIVITVT